ncbi:MAG: PIN domain nuclease [Deltaproteobacteria bacterium]|nr:PIN domain nuclease [Deltaproteobacteria bacterium]
MILVDTSVWIDFFRGTGSPQAKRFHALLEDDADIFLTGIVITEILQGIKRDEDYMTVKDYLYEFPIQMPKGVETYVNAAAVYGDCRRRGRAIRKTVDCIIAAICIENSLSLLHKDKDFDEIASCTRLKVLKT